MTIDELTRKLDELSWEEQVEFELDDREASSGDGIDADARIRVLASRLSPTLLDKLERTPGYLAWVLRLAPDVPGDRAQARARRHAGDPDGRVRYWARRITDRAG